MRNQSSGFPTRFHTNQAVQPHKMARGLKFWILEVEGLYYLCSENKGADQLRGYREADLRLCFRICKKPVFSRRGSINVPISLFGTAADNCAFVFFSHTWMQKNRFSHDTTHISVMHYIIS